MKQGKLFKRTAFNLSAKSMVSLMLLLIAMLMPQGAWASTHYDAGYDSWATTHDADGVKFKITALRMYNYQGNNSQFRSNPEVNVVAEGKTHTFYLGSLTGNTGKDTFYYNGEGNENPYKGSGSFSKVTYDQTLNGIHIKAYFNNQKNDQKVSGTNNGGGSNKWCTADLTIEIYAHTCTKVTIAGNWGDYSDGINKTESYSWTFNLGHSLTNVQTTPATCAATGLRKSTCSCGAVTEEVLPIDPNAHSFNEFGICGNTINITAPHYQAPEGQGTAEKPYLVRKYGNLAWLSEQVRTTSNNSFHARQMDGIQCPTSTIESHWLPIGCSTVNSSGNVTQHPFSGTYDGGGFLLKGFEVMYSSDYDYTYNGTIFGVVKNATIKNVGVVNSTVSNNKTFYPYSAALCGSAESSTIENCFVVGSNYVYKQSANAPYTAALCGVSIRTNINGCYTSDNYPLIVKDESRTSFDNCYGLNKAIYNTTVPGGFTQINANDVASGALCSMLNGGTTNGTQTWYQKLGTNAEVYPTPQRDVSKTVYKIAHLKCDDKTANGSYTYTNDQNAKFVDAHNYSSSFTTDKQATCVQAGSKSKHCSVCDAKTEVTEIPAVNHSMTTHAAKPATCSEDGNLLYYTCSQACCSGKYYKDNGAHTTNAYANQAATVTAMLSHIMTEHAAKPATCTEDGNLLYYTCSRACCSDKYYKDNVAHTTNAYANQAATVTAMLNHIMTTHAAKPATCTEDGNQLYYTCSRAYCSGKYYKDNVAHTTNRYATWAEAVIPTLDHSEVTDAAVAPTCTTTGLTEGTHCNLCNKPLVAQEIIPALGHTFADNDPGHTYCSVCKHTFFRYTATSIVTPQYGTLLDSDGNNIYDSKKHTFANRQGVMEFDKPLATIGSYAFSGCSGFTGKLTIPNSVTSIGNNAFQDCSGFNGNLTIPNSVTSIGNEAFYRCFGFTGLTIGKSVTSIGNFAFYKCSGFTGNLTIGNSVTNIGEYAFRECIGFTGLTIGNSVTSIGNQAFYRCSGFTGDLTIPNSVTSIGSSAFQECSGFNGNLTIGNSVTSIGNEAFSYCQSFTGVKFLSVPQIGGYTFNKVDCPKTVTLSDDSYVFKGGTNLPTVASVTAPCNLNLTGSAVAGHKNLTRTHNYTEESDADAYLASAAGCVNDATYYYKCAKCDWHGTETWTKAGSAIHTFAANDLTHDVCTVCNHGFLRYKANSVQNPLWPEELQDKDDNPLDIVSSTFSDGQGVMEFNAPLVTIGQEAFAYSTFTSVTIPNTVTRVGESAFYDSQSLQSVTIPQSVTTIGAYAFKDIKSDCNITLKSLPSMSYSDVFFYTHWYDDGTSDNPEEPNVPEVQPDEPMPEEPMGDMNCAKRRVAQEERRTIFPDIELDDNSFVSSDFSGVQAKNASYTRNNIKNQWGTIVVPFEVNGSGDDYDLYTLSSVSEFELTLTKVNGTLAAGTPALIRLHDELAGNHDLTLTAANTAVSGQLAEGSEADGYQLVGTYAATELCDDDYFISKNKFWEVGETSAFSGIKAAPFRAYIHPTPLGSNARRNAPASPTELKRLDADGNGVIETADIDLMVASMLNGENDYSIGDVVRAIDNAGTSVATGEGNGMENLSRDPFGGETLEQDDDGYVWGD